MEDKTISITVKCLDSTNHTFQVSSQLTVKEFKERIEQDVKIAADSQRMIFCGRVLKDEQKLEQHDLDGKAIHLVAKPPPTPAGASEDQGRDSPPPHHFHQHHHHHGGPNMRHTAYRIGGPPPVNLPSSSQMRSSTAHRMFNGARATLQRIGVRDDDDVAPIDYSISDLGNRYGETIAHSVEVEIPVGNGSNADTQAAVAALAAVAQSVGIPGLQGGMGHMGFRAGPPDGSGGPNIGMPMNLPPGVLNLPPGVHVEILPQGGMNFHVQRENAEERSRNDASNATGSTEPMAPPRDRSESRERSAGTTESEVPPQSPGGRTRQPRVSVMADLIEDLQSVQETLRPHMDRVRSLLRNDPAFANQEEELEAQHLFRRVSETFHWLAHGYHALSDLMVDFRRTPPRNLYGTPYLLQSVAVVQGVIPIQAEIQIRASATNPPPGPPPATVPNGQPNNVPPANPAPSPPPTSQPQGFGFRIPFGPQNFAAMFGGQMGPGQGPRRPMQPAARAPMPTNLANLVGSLFRGAVLGSQGPTPPQPGMTATLGQPRPAGPTPLIPNAVPLTQGLRPIHQVPVPISNVAHGSGGFDDFLPCNSHHLQSRSRRAQPPTGQAQRTTNAEPMDLDSDPVVNGGHIPVQPWHSRVPQPWISVITRDANGMDAIYSRRPSFSSEYVDEMPSRYRDRHPQPSVSRTPVVPTQGSSNRADVMDIDSEVVPNSATFKPETAPAANPDSDEDL